MEHYLGLVHREFSRRYTPEEAERLFGKPKDMHPLVKNMLMQTTPYLVRQDSYNHFITLLNERINAELGRAVPEEALKNLIPPKTLERFMHLFTMGMQYVAEKTRTSGGCRANQFVFTNKLEEVIEVADVESISCDFSAAYNPRNQVIALNPEFVFDWLMRQEEQTPLFDNGIVGGLFTMDEKVIIAGAEEMYHAHQFVAPSRLLKKICTSSNDNMPQNYLDDPIENDAKHFLGHANK